MRIDQATTMTANTFVTPVALPQTIRETKSAIQQRMIRLVPCNDDFRESPQPVVKPVAKQQQQQKVPLNKRAVNADTGLQASHHVYEDANGMYNAVLSNADITSQQNSYYNMQILQADHNCGPRKPAVVWMKWGRVGTDIGSKIQETFTHVESAVAFFREKYLDKTKNDWDDRQHFQKRPRAYFPIDVEYGDGDEQAAAQLAAAEGVRSELDGRLFELLREMFNADTLRRELASAGIDTQRMPLGKLSRQHVISGYDVLRNIESAIKAAPGPIRDRLLLEMSNRYYSTIPHAVAAGQAPPVIATRQLLLKEMATLEALADVEVAASLMREETSAADAQQIRNPADTRYKRLGATLTPVREGSPEWLVVQEALLSTTGDDRGFTLRIKGLFRVQRSGEAARFAVHANEDGRRLLWHGSRLSNMAGILRNGLRIAPPEAPVSGYMFGKGIYLADMAGKCAEYTHATPSNPRGVVLLCEAALGKSLELERSRYIELPTLSAMGLQSTKGLGRREPVVEGVLDVQPGTLPREAMVSTGTVVSIGPEQPSGVDPAAVELDHNEFIVYEESRVAVRYAVSVDFDFAPGWQPRDLTYGLK